MPTLKGLVKVIIIPCNNDRMNVVMCHIGLIAQVCCYSGLVPQMNTITFTVQHSFFHPCIECWQMFGFL